MPLGFTCLFPNATTSVAKENHVLVDVVAVPDLHSTIGDSWTDELTQINWLSQLLPQDVSVGRVLAYEYEATAASFFANDASAMIQRLAETFVQELRADRKFAGTLQRPIIFICHGFGGVLVKKSLIYSSTRTAPKVVHLWDQFVSTFAILFFGTPHGAADPTAWSHLEGQTASKRLAKLRFRSTTSRVVDQPAQVSHSVNVEFAPHVKQFHMFFFWEKLPTAFGDHEGYIVDTESAAPTIDNTEAAGIHATHSTMVKFSQRSSSDYRTVVAALATYCDKAPRVIAHRWEQADSALRQMRAGDAWELGAVGFDVHLEKPYQSLTAPVVVEQQHFYPPPRKAACFIGRREKLDLLGQAFPHQSCSSSFSHRGSRRQSFVVFGMGGSGKTELCSRYAEEFCSRYHAVFTIRAATKETIADSFCRIGEIAEMEPTEASGRHYLSQIKEQWLLIIDNADDPSLDLQDLFPQGNAAHLLITTRCPDFRKHGTLGSMELKGLDEDEALDLLLTSADIPAPWDQDTRDTGNLITKTLGYLAIAVFQAGHCVYRGICELGDYLELYLSERQKASSGLARHSQDAGERNSGLLHPVYATFDVSSRNLLQGSSTVRQDALDLLRILAFFHFENIPVEIFSRAILSRMNSSQDQNALCFVDKVKQGIARRLQAPKPLPAFLKGDSAGKLDKYRTNWAIGELRSLSLISYDGRYISMHPLVHDWARDSLSPGEKKIWASVALNTLLESVSLPNADTIEKYADFHRDILPHLEVCLSECGCLITHPSTALGKFFLGTSMYLQQTKALILRDQVTNVAKCGWVFAERGSFDQASTYLQNAETSLVQLVGERHEKTMSAKLGLAAVCWGLGRLEEAISLQRNVVENRSRLFGPAHLQTLQAMNHLGRSYWLAGMYDEALKLQQTTVARMQAVIGTAHPNYSDLLAALDNLGVTLSAWRRYDESLQIHQRVLKARSLLNGEDHEDTLTARSNLAMAQLDLGLLNEARSHLTVVYTSRQKLLGKEHPWTLWALCYLAKVQIESGFLDDAEELLLWGIEAGKRSLGKAHLGVLMGRGELARVYARQGRFAEAESITKRTLTMLETSRGTIHPDYIYGLWKLAQLYIVQKKYDEALETTRTALGKVGPRLTSTHPLSKNLQSMVHILEDPKASKSDLASLAPEAPYGGLVPTRPGAKETASADKVRLAAEATGSEKKHLFRRAPTW